VYGSSPARIRKAKRLVEGGRAFRDASGDPITVAIAQDRVKPTLDHFSRNVLGPSGVQEYGPIGSTGKRSVSGDLDIAVPITGDDPKRFKCDLLSQIQQIVGPDSVKIVGSNLAVAYPIIGTPDQLVQIDIMLAPDLRGTTWLMAGHGDDRVKGVYRNMLLALVAKRLGEEMSTPDEVVKATLAFPGGLTIKKNGQVVMQRTSDPEMILSVLGIDATPEQVRTFEDLVSVIRRSSRYAPILDVFPEYIKHLFKKDPEGAQRAVDHLTVATTESALRRAVRSSLRS